MATNKFRRDELKQFIADSNDRTRNQFFVGRKDILGKLEGLNQGVYLKHSRGEANPAEGTTTLIQGPPGIGKTSVLETLRKKSIRELKEAGPGHKTIPVMIKDPGTLSFDYLGHRIASSIEDLKKELGNNQFSETVGKVLSTVSSVTVKGFTFDLNQLKSDPPLVPKNFTVLLMIDEVQQVPEGKETEAAKVLLRLHAGSNNYPIFPVLAGMPNSADILARCGLYRYRTGGLTNLYPLTPDDVMKSLTKFIEYFGIAGDDDTIEIWANKVVDWSDCWPKHLHNCMLAIGEELLRIDGKLDLVDDNIAKKRSMEMRVDYYETGYETFRIRNKYRVVGEIMAEIGNFKSLSQVENIISGKLTECGLDYQEQDKNPEGLNFNTLLRKGFVYPSADLYIKDYYCPIPSLQSYAVACTGSNMHTVAYGGQERSIPLLVLRGFEINAQDAWGRTPLHIAAENNWDRVVAVLLQEGANPEIRDHQDSRPLELAREGSASHLKLAKVSVAIEDNNHPDTQQSKLTENQTVSSRPKI